MVFPKNSSRLKILNVACRFLKRLYMMNMVKFNKEQTECLQKNLIEEMKIQNKFSDELTKKDFG